MNRTDIIKQIQKYFTIEELVCPHTLAQWGHKAWQYLATDYLHTLLIIRRDILNTAMYCNVGSLTQRGLRCNMCNLVQSKRTVYLSSHLLGIGGDFTVEGYTSEEARQIIIQHQKLLPCNIRMETDVSWLHIDTLPQEGIKEKIYIFKP